MTKERQSFDGRNIDDDTGLKAAIADGPDMRRSGVGIMKTVPQRGKVRAGTVLRNIPGDNEVGNDFIADRRAAGDVAWI